MCENACNASVLLTWIPGEKCQPASRAKVSVDLKVLHEFAKTHSFVWFTWFFVNTQLSEDS